MIHSWTNLTLGYDYFSLRASTVIDGFRASSFYSILLIRFGVWISPWCGCQARSNCTPEIVFSNRYYFLTHTQIQTSTYALIQHRRTNVMRSITVELTQARENYVTFFCCSLKPKLWLLPKFSITYDFSRLNRNQLCLFDSWRSFTIEETCKTKWGQCFIAEISTIEDYSVYCYY